MGELLIAASFHSDPFSLLSYLFNNYGMKVVFSSLLCLNWFKNSESVSTDMMLWSRKYVLVPFPRLTYLVMGKNNSEIF